MPNSEVARLHRTGAVKQLFILPIQSVFLVVCSTYARQALSSMLSADKSSATEGPVACGLMEVA